MTGEADAACIPALDDFSRRISGVSDEDQNAGAAFHPTLGGRARGVFATRALRTGDVA